MNLKKEFGNLRKGSVVMVVSPAEKIIKNNTDILKVLIRGRVLGVYITINQPYESITRILKDNGINTGKMFFIDCITKSIGGKAERHRNCLYIASPSGLTELGIAINQSLQMMKGVKKFLFMDALSTLMIYNSAGTIARFSHFIMSRVRLLGLTGIFVSIEKEMDEILMSQISQFCDKVIKI